MTREEFIAALKTNWYLVLALALTPVAAFVAQGVWENDGMVNPEAIAAQAPAEAGLPSPMEPGPFRAPATSKDDARAAIERYKETLQKEGLSDDETAMNLRRIANLYYSILGDFPQAINHYEMLLSRHPFWKGNDAIFPNLAEAYRRTGNYVMEQDVYRRMVDRFPEDTQEHLYAKSRLEFTPER